LPPPAVSYDYRRSKPNAKSGFQSESVGVFPARRIQRRRVFLSAFRSPQHGVRGRRRVDCKGRVVMRPSGLEIASQWSEWDERHGRYSREVAVERGGSSGDTIRNPQFFVLHPFFSLLIGKISVKLPAWARSKKSRRRFQN
jgi:hypothetical protein